MWVLSRHPIHIGRLTIVPAHTKGEAAGALQLIDSAAFGTGLHPTTVLCLEVIEEQVRIAPPDAVLDVGTGSGVLALAALMLGVPRALAIDIDDEALRVAAENARNNAIGERLDLRRGGPEAVTGTWPMVLANVLLAPLIEWRRRWSGASDITGTWCFPGFLRRWNPTLTMHTVVWECDARA